MNIIIIILCIIMIIVLICFTIKFNTYINKDNNITFDFSEIDKSIAVLDQKLQITLENNNKQIENLNNKMNSLTEKNYQQQLLLRDTLDAISEKQAKLVSSSIQEMQLSNEKKLDEMRNVVDEKLTQTLNERLNSSFKTVSEQLAKVYTSLGEMKELSGDVTSSVSGLNRILTNVKARGTWAEVQLKNILDQTLPNLYDTNVQTNPKYNGRVEFAIKIPNREDGGITYLPIDSKFPMEDYARLSAAAEAGNIEVLDKAKKALETRIKEEAKAIKQYISMPETTPFAIMYLATEGLYAEVTSSKTGLFESLQEQGIMIAGPSTITALLNSLAMGFKTLAINQKANEVWKVLGEAKTQYNKFGDLLIKAKKKVDEASRALDDATHRNEIIQKKLKNVEVLDTSDKEIGIFDED